MNFVSAKTNFAKFSGVIAGAIVLAGIAAFTPVKTQAFSITPVRLVDPLCLWSGCSTTKPVATVAPVAPVTNNVTNVNNSNNRGNINSPGGTVVNGNGNTTVTTGNGTRTTGGTATAAPRAPGTVVGGSGNVVVSVPANTNTNVSGGNGNGTSNPTYTYHNNNNNQSPLGGNCFPVSSRSSVGEITSWRVSAYGGSGNYSYSWSGTDGLSGSGTNVDIRYNSPGSKTATVNIISGSQTISRSCSPSIYVQGSNNYDDNNNYNYNNNYNNYSQLSVSCVANASFAPVGQNVQWTANVSGGNEGYTYRWTGTDGISGSGRYLGVNYSSPGTKYASVTVYSNNQTITRDCSGSVTVGIQNDQNYYGNNYGNNGNFEIACFADADRVRVGIPVTWGVEATGGNGNYSYSWTGSEGLSGSQRSAVTAYSTSGIKTATVTITSGNMSASKLCGNAVTVTSGVVASGGGNATIVPTKPAPVDNSVFTGSSLFSLQNVPWGWVAVLVILVLFSMVMYLLFTRREFEIRK